MTIFIFVLKLNKISKYRTIDTQSEGMYKEKGSKFIGYVISCYSEEEVKLKLLEWKEQNQQAGHLCYAYRLGVDKSRYRANDDGEPNNSAGAPILGQIESYDLTNVLIGVVRYYGGTNLGVGGLINAYRTSAKEAIENGLIVELEVYQWFALTFGYEDMPHVMNLIKKRQLHISNKTFDADCEVLLRVKLDVVEEIKSNLNAFSSMKIEDKGIYYQSNTGNQRPHICHVLWHRHCRVYINIIKTMREINK